MINAIGFFDKKWFFILTEEYPLSSFYPSGLSPKYAWYNKKVIFNGRVI